MSGEVTYLDDSDDSTLEVSTGGTFGVVFVAEADRGATHVSVGLDYASVSLLHVQLGRWLEERS